MRDYSVAECFLGPPKRNEKRKSERKRERERKEKPFPLSIPDHLERSRNILRSRPRIAGLSIRRII